MMITIRHNKLNLKAPSFCTSYLKHMKLISINNLSDTLIRTSKGNVTVSVDHNKIMLGSYLWVDCTECFKAPI